MTTPAPLVDLQLAVEAPNLPSEADFIKWCAIALTEAGFDRAAEITVRLVDAEESRELNHTYREKDKPTNVLSFPSDLPDFLLEQMDVMPLGDLVICVPVMAAEAIEQGKTEQAHWAHLTLHGTLHLLGYDHIEDADAEEMEALEVAALSQLGIANPYE
ncbi:MAG: rRNA maturation RNase YbeY [Moraxellaceae bacterium]|jgi:probable rRNA maturation factor|nr:rRNA maturation RNase YbeY [Moraxellaceae bacterium]MBP7229321.1 rRNA maturation RNase YbeY [Moraxellaceae bacterium]MBP8851847.1 rRNA maturation RNase YbeY [Moraxellaceae bacterium]MBP9045309.1 rRNA maturation RNase YbeY [Moraxellaceae bacterium]MBP9730634.1 rRNA maturation RNase YbeY [Moraxellaceae bacterium]